MVYTIVPAAKPEVPIVVSVPHCGTAFPDEIKDQYKPKLIAAPDDTDWFVDLLYDFVPAMGISMITAQYSRWVIDLNRDPYSKPLYKDGRLITPLCPATNFLGETIYRDERQEVELPEVKRRRELYYQPYHSKLRELLSQRKRKHNKVVLWDCHSIKQVVPTIQAEKFPDLILGDADNTSAAPELIETAQLTLSAGGYSFAHNQPFKGGYITRKYGKPVKNRHALQLEMTKVNYMDDAEKKYDKARAEKIRELLKRTFDNLIEKLK
ncbi:MAG: N-formylglutamate amidohydrolase [Cyclobacteriaceae bacterium]|nr:N-formylglutamate amidohydrolase [Cyclobacteriaceae bacterium]